MNDDIQANCPSSNKIIASNLTTSVTDYTQISGFVGIGTSNVPYTSTTTTNINVKDNGCYWYYYDDNSIYIPHRDEWIDVTEKNVKAIDGEMLLII